MPEEQFFLWLILSGRGWGKTRTAVENISRMLRGPSPMIAPDGAPKIMTIVADSPFDMRQYTIEGPSGFLNVGPKEYRPKHYSSMKTLEWPNGCRALLFSAEDPESTRGASGSFFWWDELAKSRYAQEGWNNMLFGMREGKPKGIVTTTPRPTPLIKSLIKRKSTFITRGSTWDNSDNLSADYYENVIEPLEGTRLGRQEIDGEVVDDFPNALWTRAMIDAATMRREKMPDFVRSVVAVDPSGTKGGNQDGGDAIGIVAAAKGVDGNCYIFTDQTCKLSPAGWGARAIKTYKDHGCSRLIAETNYGGAMVEAVIRSIDPNVAYKEVHASRGKVARAEPVAALFEKGRVFMAPGMSQLEDQMCLMTPDGFMGEGSPNNVDAMVWAVYELMLAQTSSGFLDLMKLQHDDKQKTMQEVIEEKAAQAAKQLNAWTSN